MSNGLRLAGNGGSQVLRASVLDQQLDRKVIRMMILMMTSMMIRMMIRVMIWIMIIPLFPAGHQRREQNYWGWRDGWSQEWRKGTSWEEAQLEARDVWRSTGGSCCSWWNWIFICRRKKYDDLWWIANKILMKILLYVRVKPWGVVTDWVIAGAGGQGKSTFNHQWWFTIFMRTITITINIHHFLVNGQKLSIISSKGKVLNNLKKKRKKEISCMIPHPHPKDLLRNNNKKNSPDSPRQLRETRRENKNRFKDWLVSLVYCVRSWGTWLAIDSLWVKPIWPRMRRSWRWQRERHCWRCEESRRRPRQHRRSRAGRGWTAFSTPTATCRSGDSREPRGQSKSKLGSWVGVECLLLVW